MYTRIHGHVAWRFNGSFACSKLQWGGVLQNQIGVAQFSCVTIPLWSSLIARFMRPTWGPSGADRAQVGPMLAPWTLLSGLVCNNKTLLRRDRETRQSQRKQRVSDHPIPDSNVACAFRVWNVKSVLSVPIWHQLLVSWDVQVILQVYFQNRFTNRYLGYLVLAGISMLCYIEIPGLRWVPQNPTDGKSTLVQIMAWCCQQQRKVRLYRSFLRFQSTADRPLMPKATSILKYQNQTLNSENCQLCRQQCHRKEIVVRTKSSAASNDKAAIMTINPRVSGIHVTAKRIIMYMLSVSMLSVFC